MYDNSKLTKELKALNIPLKKNDGENIYINDDIKVAKVYDIKDDDTYIVEKIKIVNGKEKMITWRWEWTIDDTLYQIQKLLASR